MNRIEQLQLATDSALRERLNSLREESTNLERKKKGLTEAQARATCAIRRVESELAQRGSGSISRPT